MKWPKWNRSWIPGIVFWVLFLGSLAFGKRYPWLDAVWYWAWMLFLLVVAVYSVKQIFSNRHETGGVVGYRGVPRWVVTLFGGEVDAPLRSSTVILPRRWVLAWRPHRSESGCDEFNAVLKESLWRGLETAWPPKRRARIARNQTDALQIAAATRGPVLQGDISP
jgi:hypothetical protein